MTQEELNQMWLDHLKTYYPEEKEEEALQDLYFGQEDEITDKINDTFERKVNELGGAVTGPFDNGIDGDSLYNITYLLDNLGYSHLDDPRYSWDFGCGGIIALPKKGE